MKRTFLFLALLGVVVVAAARPPLVHRHAPRPSAPKPMKVLTGPDEGWFPPLPPPVEEVHLHETDPSKPSVWGYVEADSHLGWYGVHIQTEKCVAYPLPLGPNQDHVVAFDEHHGEPAPGGPSRHFDLGTSVFMRHDHKTGRWFIMFQATKVISRGVIVGSPGPDWPGYDPRPPATPPGPHDAVPPTRAPEAEPEA